MKNTSKKIIVSVLTLVLTIIALGTTTFAWFSLSTVVQISDIHGEVTAGDGLEVRLVQVGFDEEDPEANIQTGWYSSLSGDIVTDFIGQIFGANVFTAVTTSNLTDFTRTADNGDGRLRLGEAATMNADYLRFVIQFRSQSGGDVVLTSLGLSGERETFVVDGGPYMQTPNAAYSNNDVETSAVYAARVSFADVAYQYGQNTITAGALVSGNTFMEEDKPVEHGQWSYLNVSKGIYFVDEDEDDPNADPDPIIANLAYGDLNDLVTLVEAFGHNDLKVGDDYRTTLALSPTGEGGMNAFFGEMTINIWMEGWDADTYDSIYSLKFEVRMTFEKEEEPDPSTP